MAQEPRTGFIAVEDVRDMMGITPLTMRKKLRDAGILLYLDPADSRRRLMKKADMQKLLRPKLIPVSDERSIS